MAEGVEIELLTQREGHEGNLKVSEVFCSDCQWNEWQKARLIHSGFFWQMGNFVRLV